MAALRRSPVARFSTITLLTMSVLAVVLGGMLERRIADRALESASDTAVVLGEIAVRRYISPRELRTELQASTIRQLDEHLRNGALREIGVKKVKVFDPRRALVYSDHGEDVGSNRPGDRQRRRRAARPAGQVGVQGHVGHRRGRADALGLRAARVPRRGRARRRVRGLPRLRPHRGRRPPRRVHDVGARRRRAHAPVGHALPPRPPRVQRAARPGRGEPPPGHPRRADRHAESLGAVRAPRRGGGGGPGRAAAARPRRLPRDQRHARPRPRRRAARRGRRAAARGGRRRRRRCPPGR